MHSKKARATPEGMWNFMKKQMLSLLNAFYYNAALGADAPRRKMNILS